VLALYTNVIHIQKHGSVRPFIYVPHCCRSMHRSIRNAVTRRVDYITMTKTPTSTGENAPRRSCPRRSTGRLIGFCPFVFRRPIHADPCAAGPETSSTHAVQLTPYQHRRLDRSLACRVTLCTVATPSHGRRAPRYLGVRYSEATRRCHVDHSTSAFVVHPSRSQSLL